MLMVAMKIATASNMGASNSQALMTRRNAVPGLCSP